MTETRALYIPGRDPKPDGHAVPVGRSSAAVLERKELRDALAALTPKSLWDSSARYAAILEERMRTLTQAERITMSIEGIERRRAGFQSDYDPLYYGSGPASGQRSFAEDYFRSSQGDDRPVLEDCMGPISPPQVMSPRRRSRGWYDQ